jgi:hypothetical protein
VEEHQQKKYLRWYKLQKLQVKTEVPPAIDDIDPPIPEKEDTAMIKVDPANPTTEKICSMSEPTSHSPHQVVHPTDMPMSTVDPTIHVIPNHEDQSIQTLWKTDSAGT